MVTYQVLAELNLKSLREYFQLITSKYDINKNIKEYKDSVSLLSEEQRYYYEQWLIEQYKESDKTNFKKELFQNCIDYVDKNFTIKEPERIYKDLSRETLSGWIAYSMYPDDKEKQANMLRALSVVPIEMMELTYRHIMVEGFQMVYMAHKLNNKGQQPDAFNLEEYLPENRVSGIVKTVNDTLMLVNDDLNSFPHFETGKLENLIIYYNSLNDQEKPGISIYACNKTHIDNFIEELNGLEKDSDDYKESLDDIRTLVVHHGVCVFNNNQINMIAGSFCNDLSKKKETPIMKKEPKKSEDYKNTKITNDTDHSLYFQVMTHPGSNDYKMLKYIVNQGIDSQLEGFTKSRFYEKNFESIGKQFVFDFYKDELPILARRLSEVAPKGNIEEQAYIKDFIKLIDNWQKENLIKDIDHMTDTQIDNIYDDILAVQVLASDIDQEDIHELSVSEKREFLKDFLKENNDTKLKM